MYFKKNPARSTSVLITANNNIIRVHKMYQIGVNTYSFEFILTFGAKLWFLYDF